MILDELKDAFGSLAAPSPAELRQALASLPLNRETLAPHIPLPTDLVYGRKVLFATEHVDIVLIYLPPGQQSCPHNHGESCGWEWIISGQLTNVIYTPASEGHAERDEVRKARASRVNPGEFCFVAPGEIHAIHNEGEIPVISVNAYTPPLANLRQYRIAGTAT